MARKNDKQSQDDPLLRIKLLPPVPRPDLIARRHLIDILQSGLQVQGNFLRKLTLISAPAGYGKTTLAIQWLAEIRFPSAWLSLESAENDPTRFLTYLVAALQLAASSVGHAMQAMMQSPEPPPPNIMLTSLVNDLAKLPGPLLIALDDYHCIQSKPNHEALNFLVEHLPANIHLLIISREDPPLPLHRLQARRQMLSLRQAELSFSVEEAVAFLKQTSNIELTPDQTASLTRLTEGWVTGLQLAAISLHNVQDRQKFIESFAGSNRFILDYLFEEVFEGQPHSVKSFLLQTSILNRISGELANSITGHTNGQEILEHLEQANFFIIPLDHSRTWYRYHRLFVNLLRHRLSISTLDEKLLHERASQWFQNNSMLDAAIEHALCGALWTRAAELIEQASEHYLQRGELTTLLRWCRRVPSEILLSKAEWALAYAWPLILMGDAEAADQVLSHIRPDLSGADDGLRGNLAAAEAFLSRTHGDAAKTIEHSKTALKYLPHDDRASRATIAVNLGLVTWHIGQLDEAESALQTALINARATNNDYAYHTAQIFMARTMAARGDLSRAAALIELALRMGDQVPTAVIAHTDMAVIHFERNQLAEAWGQMERATALANATHNTEFKAASFVQRALFHLWMNEVEEAEKALAPALGIAQAHQVPMLTLARIHACHVQVLLALGKIEQAAKIQLSIPVPHDAHTLMRYIDLNNARLHLSRGDRSAALQELAAARKMANAAGWTYALYPISVLQCLAEEDPRKRLVHLGPAVEQAEEQGFVRVFLNEGDGIIEPLRALARHGVAPGQIGRILAAAAGTFVTTHSTVWLPEPLSARELEVLRLVAAGLSNRQIAEQLIVSLGTAKSHLHHIFGKLDVTSRTQAAARAQELGLL